MTKRRVVVTGLGMLSSVGHDVATTWQAILAGQSGVATISRFDASRLGVKIAAEIKDYDPTPYFSTKDARKFDLFVQYSCVAAQEALADSGLEINDTNCHRAGVAIGAGIGGLCWIEKNHDALLKGGPRRVSPFFIPGAIINMAAGLVSMRHNLHGPNISIVTACTTGAHNIGNAARMIAYGDADIMVAGGTEMATSELCIGGFASMRALSKRNDDPQKASRPWDKDRDGFVLGEGAGVVILEEYESAKKRGANIYAELAGFGMNADAYHVTLPMLDGSGFAGAMKNALQDAEINPEEVDYINAHGTSTPTADPIEAQAIKLAFGDHAYKLAVSSTKSMTGHTLGAAGGIEAIFSILAIRDQVAPPTINLDNQDEGCDLNFVPHQAQPLKIQTTLSNSFGFGGTNGSLIFRKLED